MKRLFFLLLPFSILAISLVSCGPTKKYLYAGEYLDSNKVSIPTINIPIPIIQPYDLLNINFYGNSAPVTAMMNNFGGMDVAVSGIQSSGTPQLKNGYQVTGDGFIELPQLGKIKVSGMTVAELKTLLTEKALTKLQDPTVLVKLANFKVTMLGEVRSQGNFTIPNDKVSILEALGIAGDLTVYAIKEKVKIIRQDATGQTIGTIDLTSKTLFTSEYFYLHPNDVVYVPGDGQQQKSQRLNNFIPYLSIGVSFVGIIVTLFAVFN